MRRLQDTIDRDININITTLLLLLYYYYTIIIIIIMIILLEMGRNAMLNHRSRRTLNDTTGYNSY